jgi:3'-phosphoadenosine 5'-phosphosulfate sulfotransferase (PAPS reductase)/FAD synthetase
MTHDVAGPSVASLGSVVIVSFGGGVNSTAMLIGMVERGERPDAIVFADTGGEKPQTYDFVSKFRKWLVSNGLSLTVVAYSSKSDSPLGVDFACGSAHKSLEDECLTNGTLPSKAFGFGGCSVKWKRQPMDKFADQFAPAIAAWGRGELVTRCIGIHAGETRRGRIPDDEKYHYRFPLREWGWGQRECENAIKAAGLPVPPKSACFFCPAMRKPEVLALAKDQPDLFARAVAMEQNARECDGLEVVKGLGRHWSWEDLAKADEAQMRLPIFMDTQAPLCDTCVDW